MTKNARRMQNQNIVKRAGNDFLHNAVKIGELKLTKILLEGGADVNDHISNQTGTGVTNNEGSTPLMSACNGWTLFPEKRVEMLQIIRLLLQYGADPYEMDNAGRDYFDIANKSNLRFFNVEMTLWYNKYSRSQSVGNTTQMENHPKKTFSTQASLQIH